MVLSYASSSLLVPSVSSAMFHARRHPEIGSENIVFNFANVWDEFVSHIAILDSKMLRESYHQFIYDVQATVINFPYGLLTKNG